MFHSTIVVSLRGDDVRDCKFRHQASYIPATRSALRRDIYKIFPREKRSVSVVGIYRDYSIAGGIYTYIYTHEYT